MLRPAHGRSRIGWHDLAGDQPVEQHAHRGELLLHTRRSVFSCSCSSHAATSNGRMVVSDQAAILAPGEERAACPRIGAARVRVADVGGEEFDIAPGGRIAGIGDERRHYRCRPVLRSRPMETRPAVDRRSWSVRPAAAWLMAFGDARDDLHFLWRFAFGGFPFWPAGEPGQGVSFRKLVGAIQVTRALSDVIHTAKIGKRSSACLPVVSTDLAPLPQEFVGRLSCQAWIKMVVEQGKGT